MSNDQDVRQPETTEKETTEKEQSHELSIEELDQVAGGGTVSDVIKAMGDALSTTARKL